MQVYNISQNIEETDLHHLQLFTEYGRIAQEKNSESTPFQKLQFLVRDWRYLQDFQWGINGGRGYLREILSSSDREKAELQQVRKHIKSSFSDISCFLMPFPGEQTACGENFDGKLSGISESFKKELANYVPLLLAPENIVTKNIGGIEITAKELCHYFQIYIAMFQGDELPTPYTIYEATANAKHQLATQRALDYYIEKMEMICSWNSPVIDSSQFDEEHLKVELAAMVLFKSSKKIGHKDLTKKFSQALKKDLKTMKAKYQEINYAKNKMEEARLQNMKEQEQLRQKIDNMEKESQNVRDVMKQSAEAHNMIQVEFKKSLESLHQERERMQKELEEARITGKGNQEDMKKELDNFLKEMERQRNIHEQEEREFAKERMQKEALKIIEDQMRKQMDTMKGNYEKQMKDLREQMQQMMKSSSSSCTLL